MMLFTKVLKSFFLVAIACFYNLAHANTKTWFSSSDNEVTNAFCKIKRPKTVFEIEQFYANLPKLNLDGSRSSVRGVIFINERPHLVYAFKKLVTPIDQTDKNKIPPVDFKQKLNFGKCRNVLCASEIIFGKEIGPKMVYLMDQFELNTSSYAYSNSTNFNSSELSDLIGSLEFLPDHVNIFKENQKLSRYPRNQIKPGKDARLLANASMEFFDSWSNLSSPMRQYVAYHEYAHRLATAHLNSFDASLIWRQMGNWISDEAQFNRAFRKSQTEHHTVSSYATTNPWEDFAESLSAYRFNPVLLKTTSIEKYNYIKFLVFDGQEFENETNCNGPLNISRFQKMVNVDKFPFSSLEKQQVISNCLTQFYRASFANQPTAMFNQCVNYEASNIWYKKVQRYQAVAPHSIFDPHTGFSSLRFPQLIKEATRYHTVGASTWLGSLIVKNEKSLYYHLATNEDVCSQLTLLTKYPFSRSRNVLWEVATNKYNNNLNYPTKSGIKMLCHNLFLSHDREDLLPPISRELSSRYRPSTLNSTTKIPGVYFDKKKLIEAIKKVIESKFD